LFKWAFFDYTQMNSSSSNSSRIVVAGLGEVGKAVALSVLTQGICDELVLVNRTQSKADGYALDLMHCLQFMPRNMTVRGGDFSDCAGAKVVILCPRGATQSRDRRDELEGSRRVMADFINRIMGYGFDGIFLIITNPVDSLSHFVWKESGLPPERVISTGTCLDSARLRFYLGHKLLVDPRCINAFAMGEHGFSMFIPWSQVNIYGKSFDEILAHNPDRFSPDYKAEMLEKVRYAGFKIFDMVGSTSSGVSSSAVAIAKSIVQNENTIYPVSTYIKGHYGVTDDIFIGVPAVIGANGVREVVDLNLTDLEMTQLHESVDVVRQLL